MGRCPDDVLRPKGRVAAEEDLGMGRLQGDLIEHWAIPLVELDAGVPFDPWTMVLLADGHQDVVGRQEHVILATRFVAQPPVVALDRLHAAENDAGQPAVLVHEFLGGPVVDDGNALAHGILLLPIRGFHHLEGGAHHHRDALCAEPLGGAAAVHGGVAAAHDDDVAGNGIGVAEGDARQPIDADGDVFVHLVAARQLEVPSPRRAGANEIGIEVHIQHRFHAGDFVAEMTLNAHVEDQVHLLLQHVRRQPESGNLAAHHAAARRILLEQMHLVTERQQVPRHRQRRRPRPQERDALAVLGGGHPGHVRPDVALVVGRHSLEPTNGNRLLLSAHPAAGGLAGPVAGAAENAGKDVAVPVEHVGFGVALLGDQANVLRHGGVRRASPLAVHHLVEVVGILDVGGLHGINGTCRDCAKAAPAGEGSRHLMGGGVSARAHCTLLRANLEAAWCLATP